MNRTVLLLHCLLFLAGMLHGQEADTLRMGIHEYQNEYFNQNYKPEATESKTGTAFPADLVATAKPVTRNVLGWHPYWTGSTAHQSYNYDALTHIAYFSYEVDTATGGYLSVHDWNTTPVISYAHQRGTKVLLTVTNFGTARNTELLTDTAKQVTMLNTLVTLLKNRNGDGVNFDLESVSSTQRTNLVSFAKRAKRIIKKGLPLAEISMATPAVDWSAAWDFSNLALYCDYLVIMGYDYYWKGSTTAGPVAPLEGETYNVTKTVNTYLTAGVPSSKLMLGVPWYGYDWPVTGSTRKASATGSATARVYTAALSIANSNTRYFDQATKVPWVPYTSSSLWRQLWYDDEESLGHKYALVSSKNLAGIGIWALGYEGGSTTMWNKIINSFSEIDTTATAVLKFYPNPSEGPVISELFLKVKSEVRITVIDAMGRVRIDRPAETMPAGFNSVDLDLTGFESGLYFCRFLINGKPAVRKIVITKNP